LILFFEQLWTTPPVLRAQQKEQEVRERSRCFRGIVEPPELTGDAAPVLPKPSAALTKFVQSKALREADPHDAKTLGPAIRELDELILIEPTNSVFYFTRATLSCYNSANPKQILADVARAVSLQVGSKSHEPPTPRDLLTFKAKIEFESGHLEQSMADLDSAIQYDYENAGEVFNDGNVKPTTSKDPCVWTQPDLDALEQQFPTDYRPPLYRGLYQNYFLRFDVESDRKEVIAAFQHSAELNPTVAFPLFFIGQLYTQGLGGFMSMQNAKCLDWVEPRTTECTALDETQNKGIRFLTQTIAVDRNFTAAHDLRAEAFLRLKEYRKAIRDFDRVLELAPSGENARIAYNDRGMAKASLGQYEAAVLDFTKSIAMGCNNSCGSYDNRADAFMKLHNYPKAIEDISRSIKKTLASYVVFSMNIDQFRRIYPEYDSVPDDVLCEKIRALFYSSMKYADFADQFLIRAQEFKSTVVPDLYLKRGDAYAAMGEKKRANIEYDRVSNGFPDWAAVSFTEQNGKRVRKRE
jgi:tetratricopeptide (TPR) repeat protein